MNEQIRKLAEQAEILITEVGAFHYTHIGAYQLKEQHMKKFAELIIKECCDIVLAPHNETGFTISMDLCKFSTRQAIDRAAQSGGLKVHTQGISKEIKQHFGVEE